MRKVRKKQAKKIEITEASLKFILKVIISDDIIKENTKHTIAYI